MKKPNFFIVGAPKCGTTALSEYLNSHSNIFITKPKEPEYFNPDIKTIKYTSMEAYLELYATSKPQHSAVGEASSSYLSSPNALYNIYKFNKNAKIIIMIRNPIDMAYSLFSQLKYQLDEDQEDFEMAWKFQEIRKQGKKLPPYNTEPSLLQYGSLCKLGQQLEQTYSIFSKNQVKVIVFDDFLEFTRQVYIDTLLFLGVNDNGRLEFPKINENKSYHFYRLHVFIKRPPSFLKSIINYYKSIQFIKNYTIQKIDEINKRKFQRPPLTAEFRQELADYFRNDVKRLSELLDRDLMHWVE